MSRDIRENVWIKSIKSIDFNLIVFTSSVFIIWHLVASFVTFWHLFVVYNQCHKEVVNMIVLKRAIIGTDSIFLTQSTCKT